MLQDVNSFFCVIDKMQYWRENIVLVSASVNNIAKRMC